MTQELIFEMDTTNYSVPLGNFNDNINEELEFFRAVLSSPSSGVLKENSTTATVAIVDNGGKYRSNISLVFIIPCELIS